RLVLRARRPAGRRALGEDVPRHRQGAVRIAADRARDPAGAGVRARLRRGPSLAEMWGDFVEVARPYRLEEMEPVDEPWIDTWQCNWKVAVDNNLENYHVPVGHPGYHRMLDNDLIGEINAYGVAYSKSVLRE